MPATTVTVFERDDRLGGLLRYGIPDFKMPKDIIDRRLAQMVAEGTRVPTRAPTSARRRRRACARDFDAVVLAVGALAPRELTIPGRDLDGIHQAMDYLPQGNRVQAGDIATPDIDAAGKHVIIIGGGDTAADCLGTANRQGARPVTVLDHNPAPGAAVRPGEPDLAVGAEHAAASRRPTTRACTRRGRARWSSFVRRRASGAVRAVVVEEVEIVRVDGRREFRPVPGSRDGAAGRARAARGRLRRHRRAASCSPRSARRPTRAAGPSRSTTAGAPPPTACTRAATRPAAPVWWSGRSPRAGPALPRWMPH